MTPAWVTRGTQWGGWGLSPLSVTPAWDSKGGTSSTPSLEGAALRRLSELHVLLEGHKTAQLLQQCLDRVISLPSGQHWDLSVVYLRHTQTQHTQ